MTVRYFAAARAAVGVPEQTVVADSIIDVLSTLRTQHGARFGAVLRASSLLVDGVQLGDAAARLHTDVELDILPPFAGG